MAFDRPIRSTPSPSLLAVVLVLLVAAVYWPAAQFDFLHWDDQVNLTQNPLIYPLTLAHLKYFWMHPYAGLYIPVTYTAWSLFAAIAHVPRPGGGVELNPYLFHCLNIAVHLLSALIVWRILHRFVRHELAAWCGAALFALHPMCVEPVAWITGFRDVLGTLLALAALWAYLPLFPLPVRRERVRVRANFPSPGTPGEGKGGGISDFECRVSDFRVPSSQPSPGVPGEGKDSDATNLSPQGRRSGREVGQYVLATLLFLLAILAKPASVAVIPMALAIDWIWVRQRIPIVIARLLPWTIAALALIWATHRIQGLPAVIDTPPLWQRPLVAGDALAFYLGKVLWPIHLCVQYDHSPHRVLASGWAIKTTVVAIVAFAIIVLIGFRWRWVWLAGAIFPAALLPVLGLVPFYFQYFSTVADRYAYLALLAPAIAIAFILAANPTRIFYSLTILILLAFGVLSFRQVWVWQSTESLFMHVLAINPHSNLALVKLSREKLLAGDPAAAERLARDALDARPDDSRAWINLGAALEELHHPSEARDCYLHVVRTDVTRDAAGAYSNLAAMRAEAGDLTGAIQLYHKALAHDPDLVEGQIGLATAERQLASKK